MRKEGFYWVYVHDDIGWTIGEYFRDDEDDHWIISGSLNEYKDSDFEQIDERIILRNTE